MWHIMYRNKKGISGYHILRTEDKYKELLYQLKKEGCVIKGCWKEDALGKRIILDY